MQEGLAAHRDTGLSLFRPYQLSLAADAQLRSGRLDESAQCLEEGFAMANRVGDRLAVAELHRIRGEPDLATSTDDDSRERASDDLQRAVEIATAQGAVLLAARASKPLKHLRGGRKKAALTFLKTAR